MKTFQRFLRESYELLPGTLLLIVQGGGFSRRIQYGVTTGRVVFKINNLHQHGHEFKGTPTHEVIDIGGMQTEVLLPGVKPGDIIQSHLQLDGLPGGSIIESTLPGSDGQYKKTDSMKWTKVGSPTGAKFDSFHFDASLKYKWVK
jgi:hypothetical protein